MSDPQHQSKSNEWYTPRCFTDAARLLMGGIDLDPASNAIANEWINATTYYTIETNGLDKDWHGRVWMNPPYGRVGSESQAGLWVSRLIEQYEIGNVSEAVCLVNAATGDKWFAPLWDFPICFPSRRIKFIGAGSSPTRSNVLVGIGSPVIRFTEIFSQFGPVVNALRRVAI